MCGLDTERGEANLGDHTFFTWPFYITTQQRRKQQKKQHGALQSSCSDRERFDTHPPRRDANNVEPYSFVTRFFWKFDTHPPRLNAIIVEPYTVVL